MGKLIKTAQTCSLSTHEICRHSLPGKQSDLPLKADNEQATESRRLLLLLLLLLKHYNLYKILACPPTFFQLSLSCTTFQVYALYIFQKSPSQRTLGLPIGLLDTGFHILIFCTTLSSAMRSTWPNQFNLCFFNKLNYVLSF